MKSLLILFLLMLCVSPACAKGVYEETLAEKSCKEDITQEISCTYKIGKDLEIEINGIGSPYTGVSFLKSNSQGDYYGAFGMQHLCVTIKSGMYPIEGGVAFISPRTGKVYEDWVKCKRDD